MWAWVGGRVRTADANITRSAKLCMLIGHISGQSAYSYPTAGTARPRLLNNAHARLCICVCTRGASNVRMHLHISYRRDAYSLPELGTLRNALETMRRRTTRITKFPQGCLLCARADVRHIIVPRARCSNKLFGFLAIGQVRLKTVRRRAKFAR